MRHTRQRLKTDRMFRVYDLDRNGRMTRADYETYVQTAPSSDVPAAARTDARLRSEMRRTQKQGARMMRTIKQSPNFKA